MFKKQKPVRSKSKARALNQIMVVLKPEKAHPIPEIGWRLFQWNPDHRSWVLIMLGAQQVLDSLADKQNDAARFYQPATVLQTSLHDKSIKLIGSTWGKENQR